MRHKLRGIEKRSSHYFAFISFSIFLLDGMILVEEGSLEPGQKVYATLVAVFRYGREDLDVLGLTFRKDLLVFNFQVSNGQSCQC